MQGCEDRRLQGKFRCVGGVNDGRPCLEAADCPAGACPVCAPPSAGDGRYLEAIAKAERKLVGAIGRGCGGENRVCSAADMGEDADEALAGIGWDVGTCPNFASGACTNPIGDCGDIAACLGGIGAGAVEQVRALHPDVVVMDLQLHTASAPEPRLDGMAAIRMIKSRWPAIRIVVLTMYATDRASVLAAGADAFLLKGCPTRDLLDAVMPRGPTGLG